jgi:dynein heavy chain
MCSNLQRKVFISRVSTSKARGNVTLGWDLPYQLTHSNFSWDRKSNCLKDPRPLELLCAMPPIHFRPFEGKRKLAKGIYNCPVYYYPVRAGTRYVFLYGRIVIFLTHAIVCSEKPSFIIAIDLKSGSQDSDYWIKRGTALTCT